MCDFGRRNLFFCCCLPLLRFCEHHLVGRLHSKRLWTGVNRAGGLFERHFCDFDFLQSLASLPAEHVTNFHEYEDGRRKQEHVLYGLR